MNRSAAALAIIILIGFGLLSCSTHKKYDSAPAGCHSAVRPEPMERALQLTDQQIKNTTGVYSLDDGILSLTSRAWFCDHAQKTMDIQYYIFSRDNTGLISADYIVRAADRGVHVRMIIDDITVKASRKEILQLDLHENIEIKVYNPGVKLGKLGTRLRKLLTEPHKMHRRMHNKTLTVDGLASITGGRNIADEYYDYDRKYNFRDRDILLIGREVQNVTRSFNEFWNDKRSVPFQELVHVKKKTSRQKERFRRLHAYACDPDNFSPAMRLKIDSFPIHFRQLEREGELLWLSQVSFVSDEPGKNEHRAEKKGSRTTDSLLALIRHAKTTIDVQSPYLITTDKGRRLISETVARGVRVRILTNSLGSTDNHEAFSGYQRDRDEVLKTGAEVYEFRPDARIRFRLMNPELQSALSYTPVYGMHSKTMVIDSNVTVIGSYNLDPRSVNFNSECFVIVHSKAFAKNLMRYITEEIKPENAWRITPEFNPDDKASFNKRLKSQSRRVVPKHIL